MLRDIRVKIVSEQPLCRGAFAALIQTEFQIQSVDAVETFAQLDDPADGAPADLLLLDLPASVDPDAWFASTVQIDAGAKVLIAPERNLALARLAHAHGFRALIPKTTEAPLIVAVLMVVLAGGEYFPCFEDANATPTPLPRKLANSLTDRQVAVLCELSLGRTNKEIAVTLGISVATVKLDIQAILNATGARNRTEATSHLR